MKVLIDSNEPSHIVQKIAAHPWLEAEITNLPAGDIWINNLIIERKEIPDLLTSIKDGRLFNQCAEMRQHSQWCYVLILGQLVWGLDGKILSTGWQFRSVQGALLKIQEMGVSVVYAQDSNDLAPALVWLATRERGEQVYLPQRTGISMTDEQKILAAFPGVGIERATELLKNYNLIDALLCLINEDCKVSGIGPKTKQNIRNLLNLAQGESLQKVIKND